MTVSGSGGPIQMNVAGAQAGDEVFVVVVYPDGTSEVISATVTANGVVVFTLRRSGTIAIMRAVPPSAASTNVAGSAVTMPMTGGRTSAAPMAMLLIGCLAAAAVCGRALVKVH